MDDILFSGLPVADVFYAFRESTLPGKAIVIILFAGSIIAWSIMITKAVELRRATRASTRFLAEFRRESHPIGLYLKRRSFTGSPLYLIYEQGCLAIGHELDLRGVETEELFMGAVGSPDGRLNRVQIESVSNLSDRNVADQSLLLENNMGLLATAVSSAPFLGLLGTVWGVMDGFGGMAREGAANLSAVAPGISAALLTTVVGLLVALPSAIGYNLLTNQIRSLTVMMDNFAQEFDSAIRRNYYRE